jgi:hypothetical protein
VLLLDAPITPREVMTHEGVPLADVFREVGRFLMGRDDVVLFGAQAVNGCAETERMTQDVDVRSTRAEFVIEELRVRLAERFRIAARIRVVAPGHTASTKWGSRRIAISSMFGRWARFRHFAWWRA